MIIHYYLLLLLLFFIFVLYQNLFYKRNNFPNILIVSLFCNSEIHINRFFDLIYNLSYPKSKISLGLLEGDSFDNTTSLIINNINRIKNIYHRINLIHKDLKTNLPNTIKRHSPFYQRKRRSNLALLRNLVINSTLRDELYVLCIDSDIAFYRRDILNLLLKVDKDVVVPTCRLEKSKSIYDYNIWVYTVDAKEYIKKQNKDYLLIQPYRYNPTKFLKHIGILHEEYKAFGLLYTVKVDAIGGTMALIKAKVFRSGVKFPESLYKHCLETEGFGLMANEFNFSVVATPNIDIFHYQNCSEYPIK